MGVGRGGGNGLSPSSATARVSVSPDISKYVIPQRKPNTADTITERMYTDA